MKLSARVLAARRNLQTMTFFAMVGLFATGIAAVVALNLGDRGPVFGSSAYVTLAEVEDAPIEEATDDGIRGADVIRRARDGLFHATLRVNRQPLRCIVDTGATATMLNAADGRRIGMAAPLRYDGRVHTVGGDARAARGRLDRVEIAGHDFHHVPAVVVRDGKVACLLGQDLIARLDGAEIHGDRLVLR